MSQGQTLVSGQDQREAERCRWLERAEQALSTAREAAEGARACDPASLSRQLVTMLERAAEAQCLTGDDRNSLAERTKSIRFTAYERALEQSMRDVREAIRRNDKQAVAPLQKAIADHMGELRKLGLSAEDAASLKEKVDILRETSRAGESEKAKAPESDTGPRPYLNDRRMFVRYTDPTLFVAIAGRRYLTVEWSLGGVRIGGVEQCPAAIGSLIAVRLKVEGGRLHEEKATLMRYDSDRKELALQFRRFGSALIAIKRECAAIGLDPC